MFNNVYNEKHKHCTIRRMQPAHLLPLAAVLQDARGVIDGTVMFADRQV